MGKIVVPFGSQHIALPEPISFLFETQNEIITKVEAHVGYVHRGIEKAAITKFEYNQLPYLTARVCGLCSITHAGAVVHGLEKLMGVEVNKRIDYLRMLVVELDRIHSHMLANGHVAEVVGYENLFMQTFRAREDVLDILERITGNRVQYDYQVIGGVSRDIDLEIVEFAKKKLKKLKENTLKIMEFNDSDYTFGLKTKGIGVISKEMAAKYNAVGPVARASGLETDARAEFDYLPFEEVGYKFEEVVLNEKGYIDTDKEEYKIAYRIEDDKLSFAFTRFTNKDDKINEYERVKDKQIAKKWCSDFEKITKLLEKNWISLNKDFIKEPDEVEIRYEVVDKVGKSQKINQINKGQL